MRKQIKKKKFNLRWDKTTTERTTFGIERQRVLSTVCPIPSHP